MEEVNITIKGQQRKYPKGITILQVAESISKDLAKDAIAGKINDVLSDLNTKINYDCELKILTWDDDEGKEVFRHSASHVMAHAITRLFPEAKLTIGPATEDGFYYDIDYKPFTMEDLKKIEEEMERIVSQDVKFERTELTKKEALVKFKDNPYKIELIEEFGPNETISVYSEGEFSDLCKGPHVPSTGKIKAFKLTKVAGAYWRGDASGKQLQRIYGVAFPSKDLLKQYFAFLEEAEKRDHRKIGKDMEIFMINDLSLAGCPFFLPNGTIIYNELVKFIREEYYKRGYQEVITPQIFKKELWVQSGHWEHYKENMFVLNINNHEYSLKPMNCPSHVLIYKSKTRSYKELPLRIADFCPLHRNELGGVLGGLTRVVKFCQDDAHCFVTPEQIEEEIINQLDLVSFVYRDTFKVPLMAKLSTMPESHIGDAELWQKAEATLERALKKVGIDYVIKPGEGAFYGPKIDFDFKDALGRSWQLATVQLDYQLPLRFDATYEGQDGRKHTVVMIHRAILGSPERFIGAITEHFAGRFPLWLSPVQVILNTIADRHSDYAHKLEAEMKQHLFRVEVDDRAESINKKIRDAQIRKIPLIVTIGDQEVATGKLAVRTLDGKVTGVMKDDLIKRMKEMVEKREVSITL